MNIWPFGKHKEEVRADTNVNTGDIVESDVLLNALIGKTVVTKEKALEIPTIQACINLIAGTISSLPINLYQKGEDGKVKEVRDHRTFLLNNDTGDTLTASQFWRAMIEDYYLGKGGYAYINWQGMDVRSIHYVDETYISIQKNTDPIFKDYDILVRGAAYHPHRFFKILRKTKDGMVSRSITDDNPLIIGVSHSELVYEENLVRKGGNKRGFLKSPKKLTQAAIDALKDAFRKLYGNADENVVVLNDGIDFQESSNTSVEMQLNENKKANTTEICKLFGIPDTMISGNPSDKDIDNFIRACAIVMNDIECSLDRDLLLESEKGLFYWAFDTKELTRGNIKERYEAYKIGLDKNFLQIDEVREKEDLEPIGFEWITLGLDQVLFNPRTGQIYTPNTNALQTMSSIGTFPEIGKEERATPKIVVVSGCPCSGKSTYVQNIMTENDIVYDFDKIMQAITVKNLHTTEWLAGSEIASGLRWSLLNKAVKSENIRTIYVTVREPFEYLKKFIDSLGVEVEYLEMDTPKEECLKRLENDDSRPDKESWRKVIEDYFAKKGGEGV